jgi:hypothetical protein
MYISIKEWARMTLNKAGIEYGEQMHKIHPVYLTVRRLAKKHHRLAEMSCNGCGYVKGQNYTTALSFGNKPDAYHVREFGYGVKSAYLTEDAENDVFDVESERIETKIKALCDKVGFRVEFQGDPRGNTVKLFNGERQVEI